MTTAAPNRIPTDDARSSAHTLPTPRAIRYATLAVGVLDAADGLVFRGLHGQGPVKMFQSIASSLLGPRSFSGGLTSAGLGLLLHLATALTVATVYILASRRVDVLVRHWIIVGLLYGIAVWAVMNLVVLPLSASPHSQITSAALLNGLLAHALFVGLPSAFFATKVEATV